MCVTLRNTLSRGRSFVPPIRLRWRSWMRTRRSSFVLILITSLSRQLFRAGLSGLLLQNLAGVPDALLLVGIGLAQAPDVGGDLADQLAVDAGHGDVRLLVDRHVDPRRDVVDDRVRVAEREDHLLALELGAIADADDVELALEAVGDAGDRVGDETARQAVELPELGIFRAQLSDQRAVNQLEVDAGRVYLPQLPLRTFDFDGVVLEHLDGDAFRNRNGLLADS